MANFLLIFSLLFVGKLIRADPQFVGYICDVQNNGTVASLHERNRNLTDFLTYVVASKASSVRFYNATSGDIPNKVYALFQCREDLSLDNCSVCVNDATQKMLSGCAHYVDGVVWYEECMLRFAYNRNIFSLAETDPGVGQFSDYNVSNIEEFPAILAKTMDGIIKAAAMGRNGTHFAARETNISSTQKLYCYAQCTPDLDSSQCLSCLQFAFSDMTLSTNTSISSEFFFPSCQLRYDNKSFLVESESIAHSPSSMFLPQGQEENDDLEAHLHH